MNKNKTILLAITFLVTIMSFYIVSFAAKVDFGVTGGSSRTYTNEAGQAYSADAMQSDYSALADSLSSSANYSAIEPQYHISGFFAAPSSLYSIGEADSWFKSSYGFWYYFINNRRTTKKGWFDDPTDGQRYYLDPENNGVMLVGWQEIDGYWYYFNNKHSTEQNWVNVGDGWYESLGKNVVSYGSLIRDDYVDDIFLDSNGIAEISPY